MVTVSSFETVGMMNAQWTVMLSFFFFLACSTDVVIPEIRLMPETMVLRESFQAVGPERTGNWWGQFDDRGCWWEAHNTWLYVTDPALQQSMVYELHWNAVVPDQPWFCMSDSQLGELKARVEAIQESVERPARWFWDSRIDRWVVVNASGVHHWTGTKRPDSGPWRALVDYFEVLSSAHVWGQAPEGDPNEFDTPRVYSLTSGGSKTEALRGVEQSGSSSGS